MSQLLHNKYLYWKKNSLFIWNSNLAWNSVILFSFVTKPGNLLLLGLCSKSSICLAIFYAFSIMHYLVHPFKSNAKVSSLMRMPPVPRCIVKSITGISSITQHYKPNAKLSKAGPMDSALNPQYLVRRVVEKAFNTESWTELWRRLPSSAIPCHIFLLYLWNSLKCTKIPA